MKALIIQMTISHNEVNKNYSIMCAYSKMKVQLSPDKTKIYNEVKSFNPNILLVWAQQIWDIAHPNTFGKVIDVKIIN